MAKPRFIAPWHRKVLEDSALGGMSPDSAALLADLRGKPALYHCVSRVVNREFIFQSKEREMFVQLMRRYAAFSQVKLRTYCVMSNHFHILVEVPAPPDCGGKSWSDEKLMEHLAMIYSERKLDDLSRELSHYREQGNMLAAEALRERVFARMWNLSQYMKIVKQCFTQWFNRTKGRRGVLWEERFKSELVEDGHAARRVAAYIDLNPVRAGLVSDPKAYRWSGYGAATAGVKEARVGLVQVMKEEAQTRMNATRAGRELKNWKEVARRYRMMMYEDGAEGERDQRKGRAGIPVERVAEVLAAGGRLSEWDLGWCQTRYYLDGVTIGAQQFVEMAYEATREYFGGVRQSGARRMRGVETSLCTLRDLQRKALAGPGSG
jgi:REP element-mobilizing transposase RayT